jgi:hypothetical protein
MTLRNPRVLSMQRVILSSAINASGILICVERVDLKVCERAATLIMRRQIFTRQALISELFLSSLMGVIIEAMIN